MTLGNRLRRGLRRVNSRLGIRWRGRGFQSGMGLGIGAGLRLGLLLAICLSLEVVQLDAVK